MKALSLDFGWVNFVYSSERIVVDGAYKFFKIHVRVRLDEVVFYVKHARWENVCKEHLRCLFYLQIIKSCVSFCDYHKSAGLTMLVWAIRKENDCLFNECVIMTSRTFNLTRSFLVTSMLAFGYVVSYAQVAEIKQQVSDDSSTYSSETGIRASSVSSYGSCSHGDSYGGAVFAELFLGLVKGVGMVTVVAQQQVLEKQDRIPNLISLETGLEYSSNLSGLSFNPYLRGNWGLFATDFRYSQLHDYTGTLQSLDWQVVMLRIPIKNLKLNYGIGFTSLLDPKTTYFESSTGLDLSLQENLINISSTYRWTSKKSDEARYRQEFKIMGDYRIWEKGSFHLAPMVGVTYQDYFKKHHYLFFSVGVKLRLQ